MDIQATKLELMQMLLNTQKEEVLAQVKAILEDETDFWETLSVEDQQAIDEGIQQLERGDSISFEDAEREIKERFNFND